MSDPHTKTGNTQHEERAPTDAEELAAAMAATADNTPVANPWRKLAIDLGPLIIFFVAYRYGGESELDKILTATGAFMVSMIIAMGLSWWAEKKIAPMLWVTFTIVMVMGGLTFYFSDESFVKMKPTLVNAVFAAVLGGGLLRGQSYLRLVLEAGFPPLTDEGWMKMTRNWALFFSMMSLLNELVWRSVSTDMWVNIKTFGYLPLTLVFTVSQIPLMMKYQADKKDKGEST